MTQTPEQIAATLSDAMRSALTWPKEPSLIPNTLYSATISALERRGLSDPQTYALTPTGLAVRDVILRERAEG